jgi:serine/threonine protein kinase
MFIAGTVIAERFRLERPLGEGGMGAVWAAHDVRLDIPCALKFIHPEVAGSADLRARFEREARSAAQLRSPHVVQILDHGLWEGVPYMAMELLEGEELGARLRRRGKLSPRETSAIIGQVARALAKAHAAGLIHRDLKPENIFLARDDDREIAKVLDFGIAKSNAVEGTDGRTKTGSLIGTPHYMSPEQARGLKEIDQRADVWALGVIAYQCVTGRRPFENEALGDLLMQVITHNAPMPSTVAEVPPGFDAWWARATAQRRGERFQTAKELHDALGVALGVSTSPVEALGHVSSAPAPVPGGGPVQRAQPTPPGDGQSWPPPNGTPEQVATELSSGPVPTPAGTVRLGPVPPPWAAGPAQTSAGVASPVATPPITTPARRGFGVVVGVAVAGLLLGAGALFAIRGIKAGAAPASTTLSERAPAPIVAASDLPAPPAPAALPDAPASAAAPPAVSPAGPAPSAAGATESTPPPRSSASPAAQASPLPPHNAATSQPLAAPRSSAGAKPRKAGAPDSAGDYGI